MDEAMHIAKAQRNEEFAERLAEVLPKATDWRAVAYFYSALHLMDAYLHRFVGRTDYEGHKDRWAAIDPYRQPAPLPQSHINHYGSLYSLARRARYDELTIDEKNVVEIVMRRYQPLATFLRQRLGVTR